MPRDYDIAKALAVALDAQSFSRTFSAEFRYDQFVENDKVDSTTIRVSIESYERIRDARSDKYWHHSAYISVIVLSPQQANSDAVVDAETEITDLLDFWDEVLDFVEKYTPDGKSLVSQEPTTERYDKDKLQNERQFRSGVMLEYKLI